MELELCKETVTETERIYEFRSEKAIVKVHKPILSPEEYERRRKVCEKGLERFYKSVVAMGIDWDEAVRKARMKKI